MKSNIKFRKILNDLKKQPSDAAKDLKISINQINQILNGKIEITDNNQENILGTLNKKLEDLKLKSKLLMSQIPNTWDNDYKTFNKLVKNEKILRSKYRRLSDQFYSGTTNLLMILKGNKNFYNLENRLNNFENKLLNNHKNKKMILNEIKILSKELSFLDDRGKMKSYLSKIKRKIKKKTFKIDRVMKDYYSLIKIYKNKAKWLNKAGTELRSKVQSLLNETANTIGSRNQQRLPRETALFIAQCNSSHKDISLNF